MMWPFKKKKTEKQSSGISILNKIKMLSIEAQELKYESDNLLKDGEVTTNICTLKEKSSQMDKVIERMQQIHLEMMKLNATQ